MINYDRPLESGNLNNPKDISHCVLEDNDSVKHPEVFQWLPDT
jgi:hypothetical protein